MNIERDDQEGFDWAEGLLMGRIVNKQKHDRWRPQWLLDIEVSDGSIKPVVLRGFRNPGYTSPDEQGAKQTLAVEAEILRVLQDLPVTVPLYYGYNAEHGWMLMERVEGETELTDVTDEAQRYDIFQGYVEELARLHAFPLSEINMPSLIHQPESAKARRAELAAMFTGLYRSIPRTQPEPILELGLQWIGDHGEITSERPLGLGLGDVGPNQFLFVGSAYRALIDFEYGMVADPLTEIAMMRAREMMYSIGRLPEHIIHYGQCYEKATGIPLDIDAVRYLTVVNTLLFNLPTAAATNNPDPTMLDTVFVFAWESVGQRAVVEAMAEYHGLRLSPPELPQETPSTLTQLHQTMKGQIEQHFSALSSSPTDQAFARYSAALAQTLARGHAVNGRIEEANKTELAVLLGHDVPDWYGGLYELEDLIREDYTQDFERRLQFLYRIQVRREYLLEPMQQATGVSTRKSLARFDDVEGIPPSKMPSPSPHQHRHKRIESGTSRMNTDRAQS